MVAQPTYRRRQAQDGIASRFLAHCPRHIHPETRKRRRSPTKNDGVVLLLPFSVEHHITKLDRLGRSTRELLDLIERISKAGAAFRSIGDPLWDTSSSQGRLLSTLLAAIAEFERDLIKERTGEGRKRAQAAGVQFGRKRKLSDYQRQEALKRRAAGETLSEIAKSYAVDVSMISRLS